MNLEKHDILDAVVINPQKIANASVIWLHGLGADGYDFANIVPELGLSNDLSVRFVFPHAPVRPVTINAGMAMRAWFDIHELSIKGIQDQKGIKESQLLVERYIAHELELGIPSHKIILAGFSQGGAIALHCGLRYPQKLAGILALSTFLVESDQIASEASVENKNIPIFLAHGTYDPMLPIQIGQICHQILLNLNYQVDWHTYPIEHQVSIEEIRDIGKWLKLRLVN